MAIDGNPNEPTGVLNHLTREQRFRQLKLRQENKPKRIRNDTLPAGSAMYYYCSNCGWLAAILPEAHPKSPPKLCPECASLKKGI